MPATKARIVFLPLTKAIVATSGSKPAKFAVQFCNAHVSSVDAPKKSWAAKALHKAEHLWKGLGHTNSANWKRRIHSVGESFMDRIDHHEWSVKAIEPPQGWKADMMNNSKLPNWSISQAQETIQLRYPPSMTDPSTIQHLLKQKLLANGPVYQANWKKWFFLSPLSAPFAIVPLVPNLPFFYMIWRAYSLRKAAKGASYLYAMLEHKKIEYVPCSAADAIYMRRARRSSDPSNTDDHSDDGLPKSLLLTKDMTPDIVRDLGLDEDAQTNIDRAVTQTIAQVRAELKERETMLELRPKLEQYLKEEKAIDELLEKSSGAGTVKER